MSEVAAEYAQVLDQLRGVQWPARHRSRSVLAGAHPSVARGGAAEFVEYRPYRQGDETSRIDWKLVARTDRVFTRVSLDRTTLPTIIVVDASASMAFPAAQNSKWRMACHLAVGLASLARDRGDPVGMLVIHPSGVRRVALQTRRTVLPEMIRALSLTPAGAVPIAPELFPTLNGAARVVVLSDFLGDLTGQQQALQVLPTAGTEVHPLHLVASAELEPDAMGPLLEDPRNPSLRRPMNRKAREEYLRRFATWRDQVARGWRQLGAAYTMVVPGAEPIRQVVRRIVSTGSMSGH